MAKKDKLQELENEHYYAVYYLWGAKVVAMFLISPIVALTVGVVVDYIKKKAPLSREEILGLVVFVIVMVLIILAIIFYYMGRPWRIQRRIKKEKKRLRAEAKSKENSNLT